MNTDINKSIKNAETIEDAIAVGIQNDIEPALVRQIFESESKEAEEVELEIQKTIFMRTQLKIFGGESIQDLLSRKEAADFSQKNTKIREVFYDNAVALVAQSESARWYYDRCAEPDSFVKALALKLFISNKNDIAICGVCCFLDSNSENILAS